MRKIIDLLACLFGQLLGYLLTCSPAHLFTCLLNILLICLLAYLLAHLLAHLLVTFFIWLFIHLFVYLLVCLLVRLYKPNSKPWEEERAKRADSKDKSDSHDPTLLSRWQMIICLGHQKASIAEPHHCRVQWIGPEPMMDCFTGECHVYYFLYFALLEGVFHKKEKCLKN